MLKLWYILVAFALSAPVFVWAGPCAEGGPPYTPEGCDIPNAVLSDPINAGSVQEIADKLIDFFLVLAAPIAVIMTIYSGYLFLTAGDNQDKVKTARKTLLYVVVGVAVLILSKGIVSLAKSFIT